MGLHFNHETHLYERRISQEGRYEALGANESGSRMEFLMNFPEALPGNVCVNLRGADV